VTPETYAKVLELNLLRRSVADQSGSPSDMERLVTLERELAAVKANAKPDPDATILNNRVQPRLLGPETTGLEVNVSLNMAQVPTSIAHILDSEETPLVTASVSYVGAPAGNTSFEIKRVRVSSFIEGYSAHSITTLELRRGAKAIPVRQLPTLFPHRVASLTELTLATLNVKIEHLDSKELELQTTKNIWLLPRTTAVLEIKDPSTGKWKDLSRYLAAYVTPNDPEVMQFLTKAKAKLATRAFVGYQLPREGVDAQVEALFNALKEAGVSYVNSVIAFGDADSATVQRVRLPRESLHAKNANCIDGVVLFASLFEAISMNASIVLVSGHALVGWQAWPDGEWKYLETTMVGSEPFAAACHSGQMTVKQFGDLRNEVSLPEARTKYRITPMA